MRTHVPDFWEDQKKAEAQMKKVKALHFWIDSYTEIEKSVEELRLAFDFVKEGIVSEEEVDEIYKRTTELIENLELRNMLRREEDKLGVVLKINSGAGGTESQDWASMLMRMYLRWCEQHNYKASIANILEGDEAGIKSVTIQIEGDYVYGYLKSENGVHRLVRVSPYNAQGKRMTSFASVFVTPLVDDTIEININPANISWDTFRSSGAGGQNVNKVDSAAEKLNRAVENPSSDSSSETKTDPPRETDPPATTDGSPESSDTVSTTEAPVTEPVTSDGVSTYEKTETSGSVTQPADTTGSTGTASAVITGIDDGKEEASKAGIYVIIAVIFAAVAVTAVLCLKKRRSDRTERKP